MSLKEFTCNKWTKFAFWALLYTAWVVWLGNFWWLFGLVVVFDIFITRKVHWNFWKKRYKEGEKHSSRPSRFLHPRWRAASTQETVSS